ncbi:MAG: hypothetical protein ACK4UJ_01025 [Leptonema sp. (in: bacteria)]
MPIKENSIEQAIALIGIGKYGSSSLPENLEQSITTDLESPEIPNIQKGAFWGAIFLKGFESKSEKNIQNHFKIHTVEDIISKLCKTKDIKILNLIHRLLQGFTLDLEESYTIGRFLFKEKFSLEEEFDIGLITSILRFRHETLEEYLGLLKSIEDLYYHKWNAKIISSISENFIILTEPFDGINRSYLLTPLIGRKLIEEGYIPFFIVSKNPGPKFHYNLFDLAKFLDAPFLQDPSEIEKYMNQNSLKNSDFHGLYIDVKNLSSILDIWIERRKLLKKRPFLSTLERIYNPINAKTQFFSAFHPPYLEIITEILQKKEIPNIVGIRRGEEGGLSFSFNKRNEILISKKKENGYQTETKIFYEPFPQEVKIKPDLNTNAQIILSYLREKTIPKNLKEQSYIEKQIQHLLEMYFYAINKIKSN